MRQLSSTLVAASVVWGSLACDSPERTEAAGSETTGASASATPAPSTNEEPAVADTPELDPCLPIVSGCGCAYACGESMERLPSGLHRVLQIDPDLPAQLFEVERRCFDDEGRSLTEPSDGAFCTDVFYDRSPCGGECAPSTVFLHCERRHGLCLPGRSP